MRKIHKFEPLLVHTGQHYDDEMSSAFFKDLAISKPNIYLGIRSLTPAEQIAKIMLKLEKIFTKINTWNSKNKIPIRFKYSICF